MNPITPPEIAGQVHALVAQGKTYAEVAKLVGISVWTVKKLCRSPQSKAFIAAARQVLKEKSSQAVLEHGPLLDAAITKALKAFDPEKIDAKGLDALLRASLNQEKRSASVSGENKAQPVQPARLTVTFASWVSPKGVEETVDVLTGQVIPDAELVQPAQLPAAASTPVDQADEDDDVC